jgi:hypothetical protein
VTTGKHRRLPKKTKINIPIRKPSTAPVWSLVLVRGLTASRLGAGQPYIDDRARPHAKSGWLRGKDWIEPHRDAGTNCLQPEQMGEVAEAGYAPASGRPIRHVGGLSSYPLHILTISKLPE